MGFEFRLPHVSGASDREQIEQIKKFLYKHIEELQYAFNSTDIVSAVIAALPVYDGSVTSV